MDRQTVTIFIAIIGISLIYGISANFLNNALSDKKTPSPSVSAVTPSPTVSNITSVPTATLSPSTAPTKASIPASLRSGDDDDDEAHED